MHDDYHQQGICSWRALSSALQFVVPYKGKPHCENNLECNPFEFRSAMACRQLFAAQGAQGAHGARGALVTLNRYP